MSTGTTGLVAKVTKLKSAESDRFQCSDVYQLWGVDGLIFKILTVSRMPLPLQCH